jgi:Bacteriophage head to tail connecting protein
MADSRAHDCLNQHARLITNRQEFERVWQDIEDRINPTDVQFSERSSQRVKGQQRTEKVFDATPGLALDRFKAAIHSLVTPRNQTWHKLKTVDEDLAEDSEVTRYLEEVTRRLFAARYAANFDTEVQGCYYTSGKFGSMGMFVGERPGKSLYYRAVPMKQLYFAENEFGVVDMVHRDWMWTARAAYQRWGDKLPAVVRNAAKKFPDQEFRFLHVVKPATEVDVNRRDYRGMEFASLYICFETRDVIEVGGFRSFPYPVGRYDLNPGEVYGRSPCMTILPDVKMLNEMNRTTIQAAQLGLLPPMLAHRDGILDAMRLTPGAINYGGVDDNGRQMVVPMKLGENVSIGLEMMDQKRAVINDALLSTLFQILVDKPNITATEAMLRAQEKGQLIGPTGARIESEFLSTMLTREIDIMAAAGQLPEMPEKLRERGGLYEVEYDSPLSRAREAEGGVAILRTFEQLAPIASVAGPVAYKRFNIDAVSKELARLNGMPAKLMFSDEEMEEIDADAAQQAQVAQILEAAPVAASAAKDIAQASAIAGSDTGEMLPGVVPQ